MATDDFEVLWCNCGAAGQQHLGILVPGGVWWREEEDLWEFQENVVRDGFCDPTLHSDPDVAWASLVAWRLTNG
jgi:hypothetical protein